jgi:hypothetical protein
MSDQSTKEDIYNAAHRWAGEKDRETSLDDIRYFQNNWDALPGLGKYVAIETLKRRLAEVTAERDAGRELMRQAWHELNAIRARSGAPDGVSHEWFDQLVTGLEDCLADDRVPWMTRAAKAIVRPYEARAETAEAALSARDEALRVAREALLMVAAKMDPSGVDEGPMWKQIRAAIALTQPQGDGE